MTTDRDAAAGRLADVVTVGVYLVAIVAANLTVAAFGPAASVPIAFVWIGLDLTLRDRLHDRWQGRGLWPRMLALIVTGGVLSWLVNRDAGVIAVASTVAFLLAASADALTYTLLGDRSRRLRVNGSNVIGAAVDSLAFPAIAFGLPLLWPIIVGQFLAKVAGGAVWNEVLLALPLRPRSQGMARDAD
jgi:hypothetical protein